MISLENTQSVEFKLYLKIVTPFSPSWPPFSFSMGHVDPSVENPGKNTGPNNCISPNKNCLDLLLCY